MAERVLELDGRGPLYEQIRRAIARKITSRDWRPGHRIPFESELTHALGVSRMTVNRAINALVADGLIIRRRKAGSFVAEQSALDAPLTILPAETEAKAAGARYGYRLLARTVAPAGDELIVSGTFAPDTPLLCLAAVHLADERPMMAEQRWINLDIVPAAADEAFEHNPPGSWLLKHMPWTEAEHVISAIAAEDELAQRLELDPGAPCLRIERRTWIDDDTITFVRLTYPGKTKKLAGRFLPTGKAGGAV